MGKKIKKTQKPKKGARSKAKEKTLKIKPPSKVSQVLEVGKSAHDRLVFFKVEQFEVEGSSLVSEAAISRWLSTMVYYSPRLEEESYLKLPSSE